MGSPRGGSKTLNTINWYPGHMKKTKELIQENLKLVDVVLELLDARIPISSRNPDIDKIITNKPRIIVLNKKDLADQDITNRWIRFFEKLGFKAIPINTLNGEGFNNLLLEIKSVAKTKMDQLVQKGMRARPIRVMIVGVPNVGKSSLINRFTKRKSTKTGNKPGVTKGKQWVRVKGNIELLDTPGILWPKFEDRATGLKLAFTGCIKDEVLDIETLALELLNYLSEEHSVYLIKRYQLNGIGTDSLENLNNIAIKRGCVFSRNRIDYERTARMIIDEFRNGKIGKITLEDPEDFK
jgi:ribosome biogenesis GTPase A